jgi:hypothetical protein
VVGHGRFGVDTFACPKAGNAADEYEDAWSIRVSEGAGVCRVAVADGATESSFAGLWATLVVESFARSTATGVEFFAELAAARRLWRRRVSHRPLAWYAAEKMRHGAFAAFLGIELDAATKAWRAVAIGDCCLIQLDAARPQLRVVQAFPLAHSRDFGSSPYLVGSDPASNGEAQAHYRVAQGALRDEDVFLVATDALAAWLLRRAEAGQPVWRLVTAGLRGDAGFAWLVERARRDGLRNDDLTLVRILFHAHHVARLDVKEGSRWATGRT